VEEEEDLEGWFLSMQLCTIFLLFYQINKPMLKLCTTSTLNHSDPLCLGDAEEISFMFKELMMIAFPGCGG
jgi:hypothetical protein